MAHLFEHLMSVRPTACRPASSTLVERTGGESNAATWSTGRTTGCRCRPATCPLGIRLESGRMRQLVLEPTPVEADATCDQRAARAVEDDVDGWLDEQLMAHAFTEHPYRWPTIGWMEDIRALSLPDIRAFYRTWYAPNNATLVCVGDLDEAAVLDLVAGSYGAIPPAVLPEVSRVREPDQSRERVVRAPKPIATDRLLVGYKVPGRTRATGDARDHRDLVAGCRRRGCTAGW